MAFKFIDSDGIERTATGLAALLELTRLGKLTEETLVFDEREDRWRQAREITYLFSPEGPLSGEDATSAEHQSLDGPDPSASSPDPLEPTDGTLTNLAPTVEQESIWSRWTGWIQNDQTCGRVALGFFVFSALTLWMLIAGSPNPEASHELGRAVGRVLSSGAVMYFLLRRWGKGRALLIVSLLVFSFFGYSLHILVVGRANSARTTKVIMSVFTDIQRQAQGLSNEVADLRIDSVFEMLDGKRLYRKSDLIQMRSKVALAERKTDEFLGYFENRISRAKDELVAIDPKTGTDFMDGVQQSFPQMKQAYAQQKQYFQELDGLLAFVLEESGPFDVTSEGISFQRDGDAKVYNSKIDRINDLASSINALKIKFNDKLTRKGG